jgi:hypothetical protein
LKFRLKREQSINLPTLQVDTLNLKEKKDNFLDLDIYLQEEDLEQDELLLYLEEKQETRNVS